YLQHAKALLSKEKQPGFSDKDFQHITSATTRIAERLEALTKQFRKDSVGAIADFDRRSFSVLIATAVLSAITMIGVFLPVVRRLKRELQRRASIEAQLTQSNKELDSFTGIVAHDLRGPLRTINGFSHLLLQNPGQNEVSEYANHIASASKRMDSLLSSLMRYAKSTSQSEAPELVSIEDLLSEIRHDLAFEFECARAEVATENLPTILGYKTQLRQLFQNLVQNSLKYKKSDVPCEIKVHAHNRSKQRGCTIIIEDNGIGFGSQDISHIFEPFRRLNENGDKEGSGVGLAICKKIVSNHQGSISAKRKGTSGAEFLITFPKRRVNLPETV
ncbi:MAG: hypothetical protein KDD53_01290, partial [Bdellovibrionales bacterium]|nr:hypothetical protein [Bdellovibrionales bacterium]